MSAEAEWLSIQVDERGDYVELLLREGTLRKRGGETPIPDGGYRIRLIGIEPSEAIEGMLNDKEILSVVGAASDSKAAVRSLVTAANTAGGEDNITAVLISFE